MNHEFKKITSEDLTRYVLEDGATVTTGAVATVPGALGSVKKREDNILAQEKKETPKPRNFVAKNAKMGGAGQHKDKKKAAKQGDVKHKKPLAESYAEDLAKQVFDANPNIKDENAVLDAAWPIVVQDLGKKTAMSMFNYDEDFPSDLVSVYDWLQKNQQGVAEEFNGEYDDEAGMAHSNLLTTARAVMGLLKTIKDRDNLPEWGQEKIAKAEMMLVSVWDYLQSQKQMGNDPQVEAYGRYDRRDAYQRDYDSSVSGMDRGNNHRDDERHDLDPSDWYIVKDGKMYKTSVYPNQEQEAISRGYSRTRDEAKARADDQGVAEAGVLDRYRDRIGTSGQSDRYRDSQERDHDRRQDQYDADHQSRLNRVSNSDRIDAARAQHEIDVLAQRLSRMQKDDDDWEKTFDMMRDRLNRYQWSSQRDVDPEQLAAISNIKYEPRKKNETVQAKTDDKLLAYYAQRKAEKEKQKQQGVAEGLSKRDQQDVAAIKAAIARLESQLNHPNADKAAIQQSIEHERKRLALYGQGVAEVAPPGWEKTVKAMKKHDNIDNPFALAWSMKNKGYKSHKKESADPYFESLKAKVEELAKK